MLPSLIYRNNKAPQRTIMDNKAELCADLGLEVVLTEAAAGRPKIRESVERVLFEYPAASCEDIYFRQQIIKDALENPDKFKELYGFLEAGYAQYEQTRKKSQPGYARFQTAASRLQTSAVLAEIIFTLIKKAHILINGLTASVKSEGLQSYFREFTGFYSNAFIAEALRESMKLKQVSEGCRITAGAKIGRGMKGTGYVIRTLNDAATPLAHRKKQIAVIALDSFAIQQKAIELRDAALLKILSVINAVVFQTAEDIRLLLEESGFYIGCVNLHKKMLSLNLPVCFPAPHENEEDILSFKGLADISLALNHGVLPVTNSLDLDKARLTIVTGANQGGKSTFLRSVGCAQLMSQCGMTAAAGEYHFRVRNRVFTHFCKPEDAFMDSGKLDEELARLEKIADRLEPRSMLLMNESFASTAEREGAALAREIIGAFYSLKVKVILVTHLYEYARSMEALNTPDIFLLRAQRLEDGTRTFAILPGLSLPTSHGMDLFRAIPEFNSPK